MRFILQRKMMLVVWLAMVMSLLPCAAAQFNYEIKAPYSNETAVWISISIPVLDTKDWYDIGYEIKWLRGFDISSVSLGNISFPQYNFSNPTLDGDYFIISGTKTNIYVSSLPDGTETARAGISFSVIKEAIELKNILSCYSDDNVEFVNGEIIASGEIEGPYSSSLSNVERTLYFQNASPIMLKLGGSFSYFNLDINGDLILSNENATSISKEVGFMLHTGSLTLQGERITFETLAMDGGNLNLDGASVQTATITGGTVNLKGFESVYNGYFEQLDIDGDVTIISENHITHNNLSSNEKYGFLANNVNIKSGTVQLKGVQLHYDGSMAIENASVTLSEATIESVMGQEAAADPANIILKSGTLVMEKCYMKKYRFDDTDNDYIVSVEGGELTIKDGHYVASKKAILNITNNGKVIIENGHFMPNDNSSTLKDNDLIHLNGGELIIQDGFFDKSDIRVESGKLTIQNGNFIHGSNELETEQNFALCVKGNADIEISNFKFAGRGGIFIDANANVQPESLLAADCNFYKEYNGFRDVLANTPQDIQLDGSIGKYLLLDGEEIRKAKGESTAYKAAKEANVGPEGTDVKTIEIQDGYYIYEVYTPKGLLWVSARHDIGTDYLLCDDYELLEQGIAAIKIMNDLDMSGYEWIPFDCYRILLDGQGHTISNLSVNRPNYVAFINSNEGIIANLVIKDSEFTGEQAYPAEFVYAAALVCSNNGTIVNCGVQNSNVSYKSYDLAEVRVGGLTGASGGTIYNSYMTGNLSCSLKTACCFPEGDTTYDNVFYKCSLGGLAIFDGSISNSYFIGTLQIQNEAEFDYINIQKNELAVNPYNNVTLENCTTSPSLSILNQNVSSRSIPKGEMEWCDWSTTANVNGGNPIHKYNNESIVTEENPVVISKFTLLKEGEGEFKGTYTYLEDEADPESSKTGTIYADTTYTVVHTERFSLTATPAEGYELDRVVKILDGKEKDTLNMKAGEPLAYNVVVADTLKAYFKPIEIIPEPEPEVITTDSVLTATQVNGKDLVVDNDKEEYLELKASGIAVPSLTINAGSSAVLELSGTNDLGTVTNNGTLIVQNVNGSLNAAIQNNGTFTDYTGKVTEVEGYASLSIEPITDNANDGETVTLVATAIADGTVSFQWQRQEDDGSWTNIEQTELMTRAMMLRAASEQTDELIVPLSEAGWYRCLITYKKGNTSTTLVAYAEVSDDGEVEEPENPEEDNPNLPDYPDYYNIYIETCEGVEATLSTKIVREGNSMTFTLETEEGYTDENITVKFKRSMFGYWETATPDEKGVYQIHNIYADIYITVEGVEEENPTGIKEIGGIKVYAKDGSIYVQTPKQEQVLIISISGAIVKNEKQIGLQRYDGLQRGVYVVKVGKQVFKIRN